MWFSVKTGQQWSLDTGRWPVSLLFERLYWYEYAKKKKCYWLKRNHVPWNIKLWICRSPVLTNSRENVTHIYTFCNATMSLNKTSFSISELKLSFLLSQTTELQDGRALKWWNMSGNRKCVNSKMCSTIIMITKRCEEKNVRTSLADRCGPEWADWTDSCDR